MPVPGDTSPSASSIEPAPAEPEPPERLSASIVEEAGDWSGFAAREEAIAAAADAVARHPGCGGARGAEACVVLADDALLRSLNHTYRGKDKPTNVLSFPFREAPGIFEDADEPGLGEAAQPRHLGDVVLAVETLRGEAAEQGIPPVHHLQHLVVHGLLHLLGFDHETEPEAEVMERLETQILATLGVPDPYAAAEGR
jgi:probable rRNA maturation factor